MKPVIQKEQIVRTYNGKPGCACGCRGTYHETPRAYGIALKKYAEAPEASIEAFEGMDGESIVAWDSVDGSRTYTIYYKAK